MAQTPAGVFASNFSGNVTISNNHFKNLFCSLLNIPDNFATSFNNILYGEFVSAGYNAANRGIGAPQDGYGRLFVSVFERSNPSLENFGQTMNTQIMRSGSMPSTGSYMVGHFVENVSPSVLGSAGSRYIVKGWLRITTGSNHTLNTDWLEVRTLTGT